jgi:hypothetical protein
MKQHLSFKSLYLPITLGMALLLTATLFFTSCKDDEFYLNDLPALSVSQKSIEIAKEATAVQFTIESNRKWVLDVESSDPSNWYRIEPESKTGENTQTVTVTVLANNGGSRTLTITIQTATLSEQVVIAQAGEYNVEVIYADDFGSTATEPWPSVDTYTGWNKTGTGADNVTYASENGAASVRNNASSSGYTGASGACNVMMAAAGASFRINEINPSGMTSMTLTFGSNETSATLKLYYSTDGAAWSEVAYEKTTAAWGLVSTAFSIPAGSAKLYLKYTAGATQYGTRVDDVKLTGSATGGPSGDLSVAPTSLDFTAAAETKSFNITSTKTWTVTSSETWCTVSPDNGSNNATISVTVVANTGAQRTATITVVADTETKTVAVTQAENAANIIWRENAGNAATASPWPSVGDYTGWQKEGAGAANVTYATEGPAASVRNSAPSSGYAGASGDCNVMMAAAGNSSFLINDINPMGATTLTLSFGSNETNETLQFFYSTNGTNWTEVGYSKTSTTWDLVSLSFAIPAGSDRLYLKYTAAATTYATRVDDMKLVAGGTVTTPPNPTVTTTDATGIGETTATVGGSYIAGSDAITETGVEYKTGAGAYTAQPAQGTATPFTVSLTGLTSGTEYTFRAYAKTAAGTFYGYEKLFSTTLPAGAFIWKTNAGDMPVTSNTNVNDFPLDRWSTTGSGADNVTYTNEGGPVTIRTSNPSSEYTGASGGNNVFFGTNTTGNPVFRVNNINVNGLTSATLTFGSYRSSTYDNAGLLLSYSSDGNTWTSVTYTRDAGSWTLANAVIPTGGTTTLYLKWEATVGSQYRIDDLALTSNGTVIPPGPSSTLTVNPATLEFVAAGEQKSFAINSNTSWTVTSSETWCTVGTPSGSNDANISVTAVANTGTARSATITVSGTGVANQTVLVTQAAAASGPSFTKAEWDFSTLIGNTSTTVTSMVSSTGNGTLTVTANSSSFTATTAPVATNRYVSTTNWGVDKYWIMEIPVSGFTGGNVDVTFTPQGSNTGPRDFAIEWSANGSSWSTPSTAEQYEVKTSGDNKTFTIAPSGLTTRLFIRLRVTSTTSVNGGTVASGGTSRLTGKVTVEKQ